MKNFKKFMLMLLVTSGILASCGKKDGDKLVKTWRVTDIETQTDLPDSVKTAMMADAKMVFTKDGHYTTAGGIGADEGTYTLDKEGKVLSTVSTSGKSNEVYNIDDLSDDKLKLTNKGNTVTCTAVK